MLWIAQMQDICHTLVLCQNGYQQQAERLSEPKPFSHKQLLYPNWSTYYYDWSQLDDELY